MQPIVVAGGGIGGVTAALALARMKISTIVLEQAPELGEIGAGIQIAPNAFHCFDRLGLGDRARSQAIYVDRLRLMDAVGGEEIVHIPIDDAFRRHFRNPYAVVHRADLHGALLDAARATGLVEIRTSHRVERYEQDGSMVTVYCTGREPVRGAALIGADGLRSAIRAQMLADGEPIVSGHTTFRSVIPFEQMPEDLRWNAATLWAGPKCHIVHYPLKGWKVFNLVVTYHSDAKEAVGGVPVSVQEVKRGFEHIHPRAQRVIEHGSNWKLWVLCDREPVDRWVDGRVALLGDAAHPMLQYFAQGAAMAMEDGVTLAELVADSIGDLEGALRSYQTLRIPHTARVQLGSREIGQYIYHPAGATAMTRNHVMRSWSPEEYYHRLDWLYSGSILPDSKTRSA
jgi:3-hydroxybenzoate 6-monooxygenase